MDLIKRWTITISLLITAKAEAFSFSCWIKQLAAATFFSTAPLIYRPDPFSLPSQPPWCQSNARNLRSECFLKPKVCKERHLKVKREHLLHAATHESFRAAACGWRLMASLTKLASCARKSWTEILEPIKRFHRPLLSPRLVLNGRNHVVTSVGGD